MSGTGDIEIEDASIGPDARRARREMPQRQMSEDRGPDVVLEMSGPTGPTPDEAIADAAKALKERDGELAAERARAQSAETAAAHARDQAARERQARITDRVGAVGAANEAAKADRTNAIAMKKAARESGDLDAEIKADDLLASANHRLNTTADQIEHLKSVGAGQGGDPTSEGGRMTPAGGNQGGGYSATAKAWIAKNTEFNTDPAFKGTALAAHDQALEDGIMVDSPAYLRALDTAAAAYRASKNGNNREDDMGGRNSGRRESSEGAPPSRGNGGHGGAQRAVKTPLGTLTVSRRADGKLGIQIPPAVRADFEEGARITGMSLGEYAYEQVKIVDEIAAGGNGGLITEEGNSYR